MAVRRISELPNLDVVYPQSELSDCLVEMSYAQPSEPRRYQSFYENGENFASKIADYLSAHRFVTLDDLVNLGLVTQSDLNR